MDLGQIAAAGAQLLPDVGDGIQTDDIHAPVGQKQEVFRHVIEHGGVVVVQIPLIGVEAGHNDLAVLQLGKAAGGSGWEHLRNRLLKLPGNIPAIVEKIPRLILPLPGSGLPGPLMILTGVIHNKVQADTDLFLPAGVGQLFQVFHRAQPGLDRAEIRDGVAAVAAALGRFQQGHQVKIIHPALLEVGQFFLHTLQAAGKGVHIEHHAQHIPAAVPVGVLLPPFVLVSEGDLPLIPTAPEHIQKVLKGPLIVV